MVSFEEREMLMRNYRRAPDCKLALVLRAVAGLLIIAGIVVIGVQVDRSGDVVAGEPRVRDIDSTTAGERGWTSGERGARVAAAHDADSIAAETLHWNSDAAMEPTPTEVNPGTVPPKRH